MTKRLYAVYLGGPCQGATIELHDVVFVIAESIKKAYPALAKKWFGDKNSVHIDSWIELTHVDGHEVSFKPPADKNKKSSRLFFVNVGSYKENKFGEEHDFLFLAGQVVNEVRARAKLYIQNQKLVHIDNLTEVDELLEIKEIDGEKIYLIPTSEVKSLKINQVYWPIKSPKK